PKTLLAVGPETILEFQERALRAVGIERIAVVTGHGAERVRATLGDRVEYLHNERYRETNSLYSLWAASDFGRPGCLILNSDVLFHPLLLARLLESESPEALLVDFRDGLGEEEMKVIARDGWVAEISKNIDPRRAEGENLGILKAGPRGAADVFDVAGEFARKGEWNLWVPHAVEALVGRRPFRAISTDGLPWIEIDYRHDLERARRDVYPLVSEALNAVEQRRHPG
ncbi:MAG: NTP transferase domain-containing protein, partial [Candidatus Sumerlaeota bacterium]|nr:NTP transferase domain-containing protein [Candidatus Sumerlaeota bacterium]